MKLKLWIYCQKLLNPTSAWETNSEYSIVSKFKLEQLFSRETKLKRDFKRLQILGSSIDSQKKLNYGYT
jgi:hypothetical protein